MRRSGQAGVVGGDGEKGGDEYGHGGKADFLSAVRLGWSTKRRELALQTSRRRQPLPPSREAVSPMCSLLLDANNSVLHVSNSIFKSSYLFLKFNSSVRSSGVEINAFEFFLKPNQRFFKKFNCK